MQTARVCLSPLCACSSSSYLGTEMTLGSCVHSGSILHPAHAQPLPHLLFLSWDLSERPGKPLHSSSSCRAFNLSFLKKAQKILFTVKLSVSASSSIICAFCVFLTRSVTEGHRDFFFFGMLQFYLEASVSLNVCDMTGTQNKFTDANLDIAGAFVAKAPLSH